MDLGYWFYRFKYRYARELNLSKPVDVSLELSSSCNQNCSYCYHSDQKNLPFKKGLMRTSLALKVIHEAAEIGVNSLKMNYRGESTLHPDFELITREAKRHAFGLTFIDRITNSNFKFNNNNTSVFRGLANQTKVKVSMDSFVPGVMHNQRAGSNLELCLKNIDKFYWWPKRETELVIQAVRTQLNKDEDIAGECEKRWPGVKVNINDMVTGRVEKDLSKYTVKELDPSQRQSCVQAHARLIVNWDGNVTVCCPDLASKLVVGDSNKDRIDFIWKSNKAMEIRKSLLNKKAFEKDPCKTCPSHESYAGFKGKWES